MDKRKIEEGFFRFLMIFSTVIVVGSFVLILVTIFIKGFASLSIDMLIKTPRGGYYIGKEGGILNAILGSLVLGIGATFLAFLITLPIALYLNSFRYRKSRFSIGVRFFMDVLWGIPSVVYGAFGFTIMAFLGLHASLLAGTITVALLITPIMARSIDEVLKMIPSELKEASLAVGATTWETAAKVIFRQAFPGILSAVLISFGRGIGDAAAVFFTASFTDSLPYSLFKPVATLPLAIFFQLGTPFPEVQGRGYASALVLTVMILGIAILARFIGRRFTKNIVK
ncbi:MAG: phosphate ABC transporter permease PstA [Chitinispirillaceae bacterium]|nr:phosphate ABC transporter permease PstA [Chitinispirillaceae bacterium]